MKSLLFAISIALLAVNSNATNFGLNNSTVEQNDKNVELAAKMKNAIGEIHAKHDSAKTEAEKAKWMELMNMVEQKLYQSPETRDADIAKYNSEVEALLKTVNEKLGK